MTDNKTSTLQVKVSPSEYQELVAAAKSIGLPASTWARVELLKLARELRGNSAGISGD